MLRITVELLPGGDESRAEVIGVGKVCNLREHPAGSELGTFHAFFEANEPPMNYERPPYLPADPRRCWHKVSGAVVKDFPRRQGSFWDLIATMLRHSGRGVDGLSGRPD